MTAVAVAEDSARYDAMDATTNTASIGGGSGAGVETDIVYQGTASISRKVRRAGFYTTTGAARNMTTTGRSTWLVKTWLTNYGSLSTTGNSHVVRVGSGTGDFYEYTIGSPTVNYPARGGWVIDAIDPNIASHRDRTTGTPALTACDFFAAYATCSTSKAENLCLDAIDVGVGLYLTGGTSPDSPGDMSDFVGDDEGDITNGRFGYVFTAGGIPNVFGKLIVGATSASGTLTTTATRYADTGQVVVFPENRAAAGFSGWTFDLGNASTDIGFTRCAWISNGTSAGEDTRAVVDVTGTSGALNFAGGSISGFADITLTSACSFKATAFSQCGQIIAAGADLTGSSVANSTAASSVLWNVATDTDGLLDGMTFESGGSNHAIELGTNTPTTIDLRSQTFTGYATTDGSTGNEVIYNNSGKAITINVFGATGTVSVRNGTGASTTLVINPVTTTITVVDAVTGAAIQNARVLVVAGTDYTGGASVSITRSGSTATVTHTGHGYSTGDVVRIRGATEVEYNGIHTITVTGANSYTYTVSGTPTTPATGSPVAALVIINALTDASGEVSDTRSWTANQAFAGRARKGSSSPSYRTQPVNGTIDKDSGASVTAPLARDD